MAGLPAELQELLDKQAIFEVLARYVRAEHRDDQEMWMETWWPDSEVHNQLYQNWPVGSSSTPDVWEVSGPAEYAEKYWNPQRPPGRPVPFIVLGQMLIDVDGDVAYSEANFISYVEGVQQPSWARPKDDDGIATGLADRTIVEATDGRMYMRVRAGRYLDRFERRGGEWRVAYRIVTDDWSYWQDCTEKVAGLGAHPGMASAEDPLYTVWGPRARGSRPVRQGPA
jgi:hypothetical protein